MIARERSRKLLCEMDGFVTDIIEEQLEPRLKQTCEWRICAMMELQQAKFRTENPVDDSAIYDSTN